MIDAVIVGSGPAGSNAAYLLAKMGYDILLLEGRQTPKEGINCTGIIGFEAFQKFNLGEVPISNRINKLKFISPSGKTFIYQSNSVLANVVERSGFDNYLIKRAINAGASFMNKSWVNKIIINKNRVTVEISTKNQLIELEAKVGILASGFRSQLINMVGLDNPSDFIEGAQAEVKGSGFDITEVHLGNEIAPASFAWFVPLNTERALVGLTTKNDSIYYLKKLLNRLKLERDITEVKKMQCSLLPMEPIPKGYSKRILVVGEAAGQVKTTTNGGIYYGMIGGEIAANVLGKSFQQNRFDEDILSSYDQLWKTKLGPEIQTGLRLRKIYSSLSDSKINLLFKLINKDGFISIIRKKLNFDWHQGMILSLLKNPLIQGLLDIKPKREQ